MGALLTVMFGGSLVLYLGVALRDLHHHRLIKHTERRVSVAESILHVVAGVLTASILVLLLGRGTMGLDLPGAGTALWLLPVVLAVVGVWDELVYHRSRCALDPEENWQHALMHMTWGLTLLFAYMKWFRP
jgi:hypothetical protein